MGHAVMNYCPLVFMEDTGRNRTPDKLPPAERQPLEAACDAYLKRVIELLEPIWIVGVGKFAERKAEKLAVGMPKIRVGGILHPSPASPVANRGWAEQATRQLESQGVW
jgi:single-strand selective monofunctional uracil DNA glycosylase